MEVSAGASRYTHTFPKEKGRTGPPPVPPPSTLLASRADSSPVSRLAPPLSPMRHGGILRDLISEPLGTKSAGYT